MSADITPELLAEIKRLDDEGRNGGPEFNEIAATALPALARRVEELEAMLDVAYDERLASENIALSESDRIKKAEARATVAEQQRDEMVKALEECRLVKKLRGIVAGWGEPRHDNRLGFSGANAGITCGDIYELVDALTSLTPKEPT